MPYFSRRNSWMGAVLCAAAIFGAAKARGADPGEGLAAESASTYSSDPVPAAAADPAVAGASPAGEAASPGLMRRTWDEFARGGWVMWALLAASMVGCGFVMERALALRRERQLPPGLADRMRSALAAGGVDAARGLLRRDESALARVLDAVLARSGATRRDLEGAIDDECGRVYGELRDNLRPVSLSASLTPMLGLLGTVFGLISAFRKASELGMDDPRNFAGGIYEALYTTAFGLVIAIPMAAAHHALKGRAEAVAREAERTALEFVLGAAGARVGKPSRAVPQEQEEEKAA